MDFIYNLGRSIYNRLNSAPVPPVILPQRSHTRRKSIDFPPTPPMVDPKLSLPRLPREICDRIYGYLLPPKVLLGDVNISDMSRSLFLADFSTDLERNLTIMRTLQSTNRHILNETLARTTFGCEMQLGRRPPSLRLSWDIIHRIQNICIDIDTDCETQHAQIRKLQPKETCHMWSHEIVEETLEHFMDFEELGIFGRWGSRPQIPRDTLTVRLVHTNTLNYINMPWNIVEALSNMMCFQTFVVILEASVSDFALKDLGYTSSTALQCISRSLDHIVDGADESQASAQDASYCKWDPQGLKGFLEHTLGPGKVTAQDELVLTYRYRPTDKTGAKKTENNNVNESTPRSESSGSVRNPSEQGLPSDSCPNTRDHSSNFNDQALETAGEVCDTTTTVTPMPTQSRGVRRLVFHPRAHLAALSGKA